MDTKRIKELMKAMNNHGVCCLKLKEGENEIEIQKGEGVGVQLPPPQMAPTIEAAPPPFIAAGEAITSPMVGTFYRSPSPEANPFVKVGDQVDVDTVVGIVEAMKVMNEVKAGVKGFVRDILIENGQPVEFGTALFTVEQ